MDNSEFARNLNKAWVFVKALKVDQVYSNPASLNPSEQFIETAFNAEATYEDVYLAGLKYSDYNILLVDYAYFQFSLAGSDDVRYAYYPNPFLGESTQALQEISALKELVDEDEITVEEYLRMISEIKRSRHPPALRYENSPNQYVNLKHPCSHIHFGHHVSNRWPVKRFLTPQAFCLLVIKHFYFDHWKKCGPIKLNNIDHDVEDLYRDARQASVALPANLFSTEEDRQFHLA